MTTVALALVYALFVWWFATGLVLLFVSRGNRMVCLASATALFAVALYGLVWSGNQTGVSGAYVAFSMTILLWGTQEVAFLTGALTGPRPKPCPPGAHGTARLGYALGAIAYHEVGLIVSGLAVVAVTWGAPNKVGILTFLVLWVMRVSAKLNLFLGVPVLNDEVLPRRLSFLRSHFRRAPASLFFPVSVVLSVLALSILVTSAADSEASAAKEVGYLLVAALMVLAIVEHIFMLVPLPIAKLWAWGSGEPVTPGRGTAVDLQRDARPGEIDRVAAPSV